MIGLFADHRPQPYSLAVGMGVTFIGLLLLASADSFLVLLPAAALVGTGSAVFHPEASRVARLASGGRHGLAQSLFQVGGNVGSAIGPILAALIVIPKGQSSIAWFSSAALLAMIVLVSVGNWYKKEHPPLRTRGRSPALHAGLSRRTVGWSLVGRSATTGASLVASGSVNAKVAPFPRMLSIQICPPCSSTSALQIASPRPVPPTSRVSELSI